MNRWIETIRKYGVAIGATAALAACADATNPLGQRALSPTGSPNLNVTTVGGREYYQDDASGELVPTGQWPASIANPASYASISCNDSNCGAEFNAFHQGMWHWSSQDLAWDINEADFNNNVSGGQIEKTGGTGCDAWILVFCSKKKQANKHIAVAVVNECRVQAKLTTTHRAGWGIVAEWAVGGWSLSTGKFGETSQSTNAGNIDESRCDLCDDPSTPTIEQCEVGEREVPASEGAPSGGGGGDCPTCLDQPPSDGITTCWVRRWFNKVTGEVYQVHVLYCY